MPSFGEWKSSYISGWKKAFDYKSKSSRLDFISFELVFLIVTVIFRLLQQFAISFSYAFYDSFDGITSSPLQVFAQTIQVISFFFIVGSFVSGISLTVRRLRDMGKRWWWVFWSFVPIINFIFAVWLFITPSKEIDQQSI